VAPNEEPRVGHQCHRSVGRLRVGPVSATSTRASVSLFTYICSVYCSRM